MDQMADPTVLYGPSFAALRSRACDRAGTDATNSPESVLLIEQNQAAIDAWVAAWGQAPDRHALQLTTDGLDAFVASVLDRVGTPVQSIPALQRQRIIERALEAGSRVDQPRQYTEPVSRLMRACEAHEITTPTALRDALNATDLSPEAREEWLSVFDSYHKHRDDISHPYALTHADQKLAVANEPTALSEIIPDLEHVIISGYIDPNPVEAAVFARIASEIPTTFVLPTVSRGVPGSSSHGPDTIASHFISAFGHLDLRAEAVPGEETRLRSVASRLFTPAIAEQRIDARSEIRWHEAPTPDREVRHIARQIRQDLAAGDVEPENILVYVPGHLSYRDRLADIFQEFGIPAISKTSILLERTYAGRAILDAAALCTDPTVAQLERLATNPMVQIPDLDPSAFLALTDRLPADDLTMYDAHADPALRAPIQAFMGHVQTVRDATGVEILTAFDGLLQTLSISERVEAVDPRAITEGVDDDEPPIARSYELQAITHVSTILQSLEGVLKTDVDDPLATLSEALEGVRVNAPRAVTTGQVRLVGLKDTPMTSFDQLYILGATQDHVDTARDLPRFYAAIRDGLGLPGPVQARDLQRYQFGMLLANAETVHITTPAASMDGREILPSGLIEELVSVAKIERTTGIDGERRASREDIQRALAGGAPDQLAEPVADLTHRGMLTPSQADRITAGSTTAANRAAPEVTEHDGQLSPDQLSHLDDRLLQAPFSPSRLNTYTTCGFKYLSANGLRLEERDPVNLDMERFTIGRLVHDTLERFIGGLIDETDGAVSFDDWPRAELESRLYDAAMAAIDASGESFSSPFDQAMIADITAGLDGEEPETSGLLARLLEREMESDGQPMLVEEQFGNEQGVIGPNGSELPIHGIIDRVDVMSAPGEPLELLVIDFKTGRADVKDAVNGLNVQLPAYVLGAAHLTEELDGERPASIDAAFREVRPPRSVTFKRSLRKQLEQSSEGDVATYLTDVAIPWLTSLIDGIHAGAFQPAFVGAADAGCRYCEYSEICDVRHHRRFQAIEAIDTESSPVYIPPSARPGDNGVQHGGGT